MAENDVHGLTEEALDAMVDLFVEAVEALVHCQGASARFLPEERHLPLRFTDLYSSHSGQIAAILAANGKAVDVVGTWINVRNRVVGEISALGTSHAGNPAQVMHAVAAPVRAGFAAVLAHTLPRGTHQELHAMRETLGKALDGLIHP